MPSHDEQHIIDETVSAVRSLQAEVYYPEAGMTVTLHPDDAPGATRIAGCRVVRDPAMPPGNVSVGYEHTDREDRA